MLDKRLQTVFFYLLFSIQSQFLFHFQFHRKAMGIPSCLTGYHIALHGTIAGDHIFDYTGQHMADMGLSVGCRRAVVEGISRPFFPVFHTFFKNMVFFPEFIYFIFPVHKFQVG